MKSKIKRESNVETIDGFRGKWKRVTKPGQVYAGQRIRYYFMNRADNCKCGFTNDESEHARVRWIVKTDAGVMTSNAFEDTDIFTHEDFISLQAFFPNNGARVPVPSSDDTRPQIPVVKSEPVPEPVKPAKKKAVVYIEHGSKREAYWFSVKIGCATCIQDETSDTYEKAVAKARKFCRDIGYSCNISK
jgi:hypothetical protein